MNLDIVYDTLLPFTLVCYRVAGLVFTVPVFGGPAVAWPLRVVLSVALAALCFPSVAAVAPPVSLIGYLGAAALQAAVGAAMGLTLSLVFVGLQMAGSLIGQQMGLGMAGVMDPTTGEQQTVMAQFHYWLGVVLFAVLDGHVALFEALLSSFQAVPLTSAVALAGVHEWVIGLLTSVYTLVLQIAAPVILAALLAGMAAGFISRMLPHVHALALELPTRIVLGMSVLAVSLGTTSLLASRELRTVLNSLSDFMQTGV